MFKTESDLLSRPSSKSLPRFMAVIFANGVDDDSCGVAVRLEKIESVQFDDKVYKPTEDLTIENRHLIFKQGLIILNESGKVLLQIGGTEQPYCVTMHQKNRVSETWFIACNLDRAGGTFYINPTEFDNFTRNN